MHDNGVLGTCLGFLVAVGRFVFVIDRKRVEARFEESNSHLES